MKDQKWKKIHRESYSMIWLCLFKEIKHNVVTKTSTKLIQKNLEKLYLDKYLTNQIDIKKEFIDFVWD